MGKGKKDRTHPIVIKPVGGMGIVIEVEGAEVAAFSHHALGSNGMAVMTRTIEAISRTYGIPVKDER